VNNIREDNFNFGLDGRAFQPPAAEGGGSNDGGSKSIDSGLLDPVHARRVEEIREVARAKREEGGKVTIDGELIEEYPELGGGKKKASGTFGGGWGGGGAGGGGGKKGAAAGGGGASSSNVDTEASFPGLPAPSKKASRSMSRYKKAAASHSSHSTNFVGGVKNGILKDAMKMSKGGVDKNTVASNGASAAGFMHTGYGDAVLRKGPASTSSNDSGGGGGWGAATVPAAPKTKPAASFKPPDMSSENFPSLGGMSLGSGGGGGGEKKKKGAPAPQDFGPPPAPPGVGDKEKNQLSLLKATMGKKRYKVFKGLVSALISPNASSNADVFLRGTLGLFKEVEAEKVAAGSSGGSAKMNFALFMSQFIKDFPDELRKPCEAQIKIIRAEK